MKEEIDPTLDNTEWQKGVLRGRAKLAKERKAFLIDPRGKSAKEILEEIKAHSK